MISQRIRDITQGLLLMGIVSAIIKMEASRSWGGIFGGMILWSLIWGVAYLFRSRSNPVKSWWDE